MFESDDFDQVLSQFDFPEVESVKPQEIVIPSTNSVTGSPDFIACTNESAAIKYNKFQSATNIPSSKIFNNTNAINNVTEQQSQTVSHKVDNCETFRKEQLRNLKHQPTTLVTKNDQIQHKVESFVSPKHLKRKIINSHFDQQSKRKFPGPAGLLTGVLEESKDESIGHIELLSQDMDFTESNLKQDLFDSPLWKRLLTDVKDWRVKNVDSIKDIKQQALTGNLRRRKAQAVTACIEAVDRSVTDPLIILRDETVFGPHDCTLSRRSSDGCPSADDLSPHAEGLSRAVCELCWECCKRDYCRCHRIHEYSGSIKCTLHRDAWSTFSPYIISEYCALVLQKPTVLTTGGAFKKHYLNITLGNILAIFSSAVLEDEKVMPDGYRIVCKEDFTVIKAEVCLENIEPSLDTSPEDLFDGLDNFFSDELF